MKKILASAAVATLVSLSASAGVNIQWYVPYGVYPQGAADITASSPGTGLLANNGSGQTILQLIWCGANNSIDAVDANNSGSGYVGGDDQVWASFTAVNGAGANEWAQPDVLQNYVNATFTSGFVYMRVFQDATPAAGEYYTETSTLAVANRGSDISESQVLTLGTDSAGVSTETLIVPEPSAVMLAGLGALVLAIRRRRQA